METTVKETRPRKVRPMTYRAAAAELGVDVAHLWRVVKGERQSKRLLRAIKAHRIVLAPMYERARA